MSNSRVLNPKTIAAVLIACASTVGATMSAEGFKTHPYRDSTGVWTVCNGETKNIDIHRVYTQGDCTKMFLTSLVGYGTDIAYCLPETLPNGTRAAFTDLAYNIGSGGFCKSSIPVKAQAGNLHAACSAIGLYVYAGGKDCRIKSNNCSGIVTRRAKEIQQCEDGLK